MKENQTDNFWGISWEPCCFENIANIVEQSMFKANFQ